MTDYLSNKVFCRNTADEAGFIHKTGNRFALHLKNRTQPIFFHQAYDMEDYLYRHKLTMQYGNRRTC